MTKVSELHQQWLKDPAYEQAYNELRAEFEMARLLIGTRVKAGLTQAQLAQAMGIAPSTIVELEAGEAIPSTQFLEHYAKATGTRLKISFEPILEPTEATMG
jgi:transcriptional regulator with XRE-family HTH domain